MIPPEQKLSQVGMAEIVGDAVDCEREFVTDSLPVDLIGMICDMMQEYIKYCICQLVNCARLLRHALQIFGVGDEVGKGLRSYVQSAVGIPSK